MAVIDTINLAQALLRCRSVTPQDGGALKIVSDALEQIGFACETLVFSAPNTPDITNLYARWGSTGRNFCFAGHTDVVPPGDAESWVVDPFSGTVLDDRLIGRGAVDMKGAIAAFAAATSRFLDSQPDCFEGSISFLITGDEEGPAINGTRKVLGWLNDRGEKLDACIVGEPTNAFALGDTIKVGRRGSLSANLTVHGVAGHTAYPHLADNPVHRLVAMLADLTSAAMDEATEHFQNSTLQVSTIDVGNPATNVIPASAKAGFNIRFNDRWTGESLEAWLRERLGKHGGRWTLDIAVSGESFLTPPSAVAALIADAAEAVTGQRPAYSTTGGTSDARFIHRVCPVAEFGLVGQTMHKINEAVSLTDLHDLSSIYERVLERYFASPP